MQISLDFYRILGLPPQATLDRVQHAYRDRSLSLPRREYSDAAIAARRRIIDKAYDILTDPIYRQPDDLKPLQGSTEVDEAEQVHQELVAIPQTIEVTERDVVGALLLLHELGEYDRVIEIDKSYVESNKISSQLSRTDSDPDIILTVALSHLEIGRDLWKHGQYDAAARELEVSQEMLFRAGLFLDIRGEIQADLYKLRPYRILELLATSEEQTPEHKQGFSLLQEMLEERRGIDGTGNDYSGLDIDGFLRFIQQLRGYMTSAEQQALFEEEARRPSSVASYLAVYALIGRGFSQRQPALIRRAKGLLVKLGGKQDVNLEQSVCSLLLGQAEEASRTIQLSGEQERMDFIRDRSANEPDLLPGLCLYCESWLQEEVYPHFRDLRDRVADLKEYFADDLVQEYLEELSSANGAVGSEWTAAPIQNKVSASAPFFSSSNRRERSAIDLNDSDASIAGSMPGKTAYSGRVPVLERPLLADEDLDLEYSSPLSQRERPKTKDKSPRKNSPHKSKARPKPQIGRMLIVLFASISVLASLAALIAWGWRTLSGSTKPAEVPTKIEQPVAVLLDTRKLGAVSITAQPGPLSQETATKLVESWQVTKSKALGSSHDIALLDNILADPALSDWRSRARDLKASNAYLQYIPKSMVIKKFVSKSDKKASAIAKIEETRNYFSNGNLDASSSKPDTSYEVEYVLVKVSDKWLIADMLVLDK